MDNNINKFNYYEWINFFSQGYDVYSLNNQLKGKNANNDLCNYPEQLKIIFKKKEIKEITLNNHLNNMIRDIKDNDKNSNKNSKYIKTESNEVSLNGKLPIKSNKNKNLRELKNKYDIKEYFHNLKPFLNTTTYEKDERIKKIEPMNKNKINHYNKKSIDTNLPFKNTTPIKKNEKLNNNKTELNKINLFNNKLLKKIVAKSPLNSNLQSTLERTKSNVKISNMKLSIEKKNDNIFNFIIPKDFDFTHKKIKTYITCNSEKYIPNNKKRNTTIEKKTFDKKIKKKRFSKSDSKMNNNHNKNNIFIDMNLFKDTTYTSIYKWKRVYKNRNTIGYNYKNNNYNYKYFLYPKDKIPNKVNNSFSQQIKYLDDYNILQLCDEKKNIPSINKNKDNILFSMEKNKNNINKNRKYHRLNRTQNIKTKPKREIITDNGYFNFNDI